MDCGGFVSRSAAYDDNPYGSIKEIDDTIRDTLEKRVFSSSYTYRENTQPIVIPNKKFLVPGDVMDYEGHIGIVWKVDYTYDAEYDKNNDGVITRDEVINAYIYIIEATTWGSSWYVQNNQTYQQHWNDSGGGTIHLGRLRLENGYINANGEKKIYE